jgi:hypothetical protein
MRDRLTPNIVAVAVAGNTDLSIHMLIGSGIAAGDPDAALFWLLDLITREDLYTSVLTKVTDRMCGYNIPTTVTRLIHLERALLGHDRAQRRLSRPLYIACVYGHQNVVDVILRVGGADIEAVDADNRTALFLACLHGHANVVNTLLAYRYGTHINRADALGWTPLHVAALGGHVSIVKTLLGAGAITSHVTSTGLTPLDVAEKHGQTEIADILRGKK